jgi:hypothetical protein
MDDAAVVELPPRVNGAASNLVFVSARSAGDDTLPAMNPADIRAFLQRDRASVEEEKQSYWVDVYRELGPDGTMAAAARMYAYARTVRPDFPSDADLADDLAHQVAFKRRLMAIAAALPHVGRKE